MAEFFTLNNRSVLIKSPHFWAITAITLLLIFIYTLWPWREREFTQGAWEWFSWLSSLDSLALFELRYCFAGSLFTLPIIYTTIVYKWKGALFLSFLALTYSLLVVGLWASLESILRNSTLLLLPAAVMVAITIEIELRRKDRKIYIERAEEGKLYLSKVLEAQEKERHRIAREIHDETMQSLLAISSYSEALEFSDGHDVNEMKRKAAWIKEASRQTVEELRRINLDLRPAVLDNLGLISALSWLTSHIEAECNIHTKLVINGLKRKLAPSIEVIIFRIAQEALNNIKYHSEAREVIITLEFGAESLKLTIQDDGQGFAPQKNIAKLLTDGKLGLIGIQERCKSLGGNLEIHSKPGKGTLLSIEIPVDLPPENSYTIT